MNGNNQKAKSLRKNLNWVFLLGVVGYGAVLIIYFIFFHGDISTSQATFGAFGDFVGGLTNPLLSLLALLAILISLSFQMTELELTRREVKESTKALKNQSAAMEAQNFQNTFFRLLEFLAAVHEKIGTKLQRNNPEAGFDKLYAGILDDHASPEKTPKNIPPKTLSAYEHVIGVFVRNMTPELKRYLKTVNMIANLIENSPGAEGYRDMYFDIFAGQLTRGELLLLFLLAPSSGSGLTDFFKLVGKYEFFKHLGKDQILYPRLYLLNQYPDSCFTDDLLEKAQRFQSGGEE